LPKNKILNLATWVHIENSWLNIISDPHNVKLGLALDGVNSFGNPSTTWST